MRQFIKHLCLVCLLLQTSTLFAQSDDLDKKLGQFKQQNDLSNWIYEQLDEANAKPESAVNRLLKAQKERWRNTKTPDEHFAWLNLLSTLGYYELLDGNILGSINTYENALSFFQKHQILSYDIVEYNLKPLSNNYTRLGDYERALYIQKQSIDFQRAYNENPSKMANIYGNMAISYRSMSRLADAHQAIQSAFDLKPDAKTRVMLYNVLADILYEEGNYAKAALVVQQNIKAQASIDDESAYWLMGTYTTAGNVQLELKQYAKGRQFYLKALALLNQYFPYGRLREKANIFTQLAKTFIATKQPKEAIAYSQKSLVTLGIMQNNTINEQKIFGDYKVVDAFMQIAKAQLLLGQPEQAIRSINLSLTAADKIRDEFGADITKERLQKSLKQIAEQGIAINYLLFQKSNDRKYLYQILLLAEQSKSRTLLEQMERSQSAAAKNVKADPLLLKKQSLERAIIYQEKQFIELKTAKLQEIIAGLKFQLALVNKKIAQKHPQEEPLFTKEINLALLPKHRFIEYFFGDEHVYIININQQKIEGVLKLNHAPQIRETVKAFVQTYFQQGPTEMANAPQSFYKASNKIYQLIFAPLGVKPQETLTIIPDGILGYLSFDGLITRTNYVENIAAWPLLIKVHLSSYAFSLKTLLLKKPKKDNHGFAGLFITHAAGKNAPLLAVEQEAAEIKKNIKGVFLYNDEVNAKSFEQQFVQRNILHIGTHAYLSGPNQEPTLDFEQEKMYLFELSAKQQVPSLVVLSACRTADGVLADGEGIISLSRGFNAIGTSATIAGLWNVNDRAVAYITTHFYQSLLKGNSGTEALRTAKLAWINDPQTSSALMLPYYWDSLVYIGKNQTFELEKPFFSVWMLWAFSGLAVILTCIFTVRILARKTKVSA